MAVLYNYLNCHQKKKVLGVTEKMIILINGAFGVGKTSVASELKKTINNSMIFDPEEIGYMLRNIR